MQGAQVPSTKTEILIVDDTLPNLRLLSTMLATHGYEVLEAPDGPTALSIARSKPPDLILMDVRMPGMDGYQVCECLKEDPITQNIPVIFVSALDEQTDKVQGFAVGGVDYITKPLQVKEVIARVDTHLTLRNLQRQLESQNAKLQQQIQERERIEAALQIANDELEQRVEERTAELLEANQALKNELVERKRAEQALLESERFNQSMIAATPDIVYVFDIREQQFIYTNQNVYAIIGYTQEEIAKMGADLWVKLIHPEDIAHAKQTPERWEGVDDGVILTAEYRMKTKDGVWRWLQGRDTVFKRMEDGKVQLIIGTANDITERKQSEAEREHLFTQAREIMNTVPEGMLLLDANGKILLANPVAQRDLKDLAGAYVGDTLTHLGDRPLEELLNSPPRGLWHEVKLGRRIFEVIARPMASGPQPQRWAMVVRDATQEYEIQQNVQQQERLAAVGQMAAGIAHDFNNILAVILLYTEIMLGSPDMPDQLTNRLVTISEQARRASDLIQQILDFSRRSVLERRPMDLLPFLKEQVKLLERTLPENIRLRMDYKKDELMVEADPTRLQQAIMNLAVNARDAMPDGGDLCIELSRCDKQTPIQCVTCGEVSEGDWLRISVSDNGAGIPETTLPHIFEPFFTTKPPGQGTGLGLAQVYGILKQHDGHVDVTTQDGNGSTFNLYLPILKIQKAPVLEKGSGSLLTGQGETILVVEDEVATRQALVDSLSLLNYQVVSTSHGKEAMAILDQQNVKIDLVLSDVVMPEMGGIALLRAIRKKGLFVPVVLMTGHPMQEELEDLLSEGLAAWLLKPPRLKLLADLIAKEIRNHQ
jgi:two-component system cell cycle sensor histidine kinase/response regulator CckA